MPRSGRRSRPSRAKQKPALSWLSDNDRYYDPGIGRFISADTIVPGNASGSMEGIAVKPLTVSFHEGGFLGKVNGENKFAFWFQLDNKSRQQVGSAWGPINAQALNRYSYVQNNPLKYTDPTGHEMNCVGNEYVLVCTGGVVYNDSSNDIYVIGERPIVDENGHFVLGPDGSPLYEEFKIRLRPGESSLDYGMMDADFIQPVDTPISGYAPDSGMIYKVPDYGFAHVTDNPFNGEQRIAFDPYLKLAEAAGKAGWIPYDEKQHPKCVENEDPDC